MGLRRSVVWLSALVALTSLFASACRKGALADSHDAAGTSDASSADAASADAASARVVDDAAVPMVPVRTAEPASTAAELSSLLPATPPTPFSGTYRCFGGMKLEQAGRFVTATVHKGTTDTVVVCTAGSDTCTGTVREIQTVQGKPPKVMHVKPVTLTLTTSGDVVYVVGAVEKKAGRGEQTFCARR